MAKRGSVPPVTGEDVMGLFLLVLKIVTRRLGHGITASTGLVLIALFKEQGRSMSAVARDAELPLYTVSKVCRMLEDAGVLRLMREIDNRRTVCVYLTDFGEDLRSELLRVSVTYATRVRARSLAK